MDDLKERKFINEMLQDKSIQNFINEHEIDKIEFDRYITIFMAYYTKKGLCEGCTGLSECKQSRNGLYPVLEKDGTYIDIDYQECEYLEKNNLKKGINPHIHLYSTSFMDLEGNLDIKPERAEALKFIKEFMNTYEENPHQKGLYLYGTYGCGKSYILSFLANQLGLKGIDVAYVYYPDFVRKVKGMIKEGGINELVDELKKMPVLFLDDFGGESNTEFIRDEVLLPILQYRMVNKKPIFISSNLNDKEIIEHLCESTKEVDHVKAVRVFERIKTLVAFLELKGSNYRQ